jgi:diguanylate cyclase (GGDEF)-like protein
MANWNNALLLLIEGLLYFVAMTALFRIRHRFGIGIFFCALGTMHFLETYLAAVLYLTFPFGVILSPGSIVLFSGKLVMLLLVYIREDAAAVRQPIYGLLAGNFLMVGLVWLMRYHIVLPVEGAAPDFSFMDAMGGLMIWGTILLFIDAILIVLLYERSAAWFGGSQLARIAMSAGAILTLDQLGFFLVLKWFVGLPWDVLFGGWAAKMIAAVFYGSLAAVYLRYAEPVALRHGDRRRTLSDVFDTLTYRQRYETLLRQTGRDALTGLLDRGRFDREASEAIADAAEAKRPISLLVIDLDHFKSFNDRFGHATGDEILRRTARALGGAIRERDCVYRYGGEEFVVLCDGLSKEGAMLLAERLRRTVADVVIAAGRITASIGVATGPEEGVTLGELFGTADARLYSAKEGGRDRIVGRAVDRRTAGNETDPTQLARRPA